MMSPSRTFEAGLRAVPFSASIFWAVDCLISLAFCPQVDLKLLNTSDHHHHHRHYHHLSLNREGRWGTTGDFTTSFLHFCLFSTAPWDLSSSGTVHSLMLSSHELQACPFSDVVFPRTPGLSIPWCCLPTNSRPAHSLLLSSHLFLSLPCLNIFTRRMPLVTAALPASLSARSSLLTSAFQNAATGVFKCG